MPREGEIEITLLASAKNELHNNNLIITQQPPYNEVLRSQSHYFKFWGFFYFQKHLL